MSKVEVELNSAGVREMLQSSEAMNLCKSLADRARSNLGAGYEVTTMVGKYRANASIEATSFMAKRDNAKNNSILKAL